MVGYSCFYLLSLMIDKSNSLNKLNGCLFYLNDSLIISTNGDVNTNQYSYFDFIGNNRENHVTCFGYYGDNLTWYQISTTNNYILPTSYYLHGRNGAHDMNHLKSWVFEGFSPTKNKWKKLHSVQDNFLDIMTNY